jgi:S-DNA-T family DNA segregation ATPase FtsK/SpoIIIE
VSALRRELTAIALLLFAVFLGGAVALHGLALLRTGFDTDVQASFGWIGAHLVAPMVAYFGWPGAALIPLAPGAYALQLFGRLGERAGTAWLVFLLGGAALVPIAFGLALGGTPEQHALPGLWGSFAAFYLLRAVGYTGAWLVWLLMVSGLMAATLHWNPVRMIVGRRVRTLEPADGTVSASRTRAARALEPDPEDLPALEQDLTALPPVRPAAERPNGSGRRTRKERAAQAADATPSARDSLFGDSGMVRFAADEELPPIDLLERGAGRSAELTDEELEATGRKLVEALETFSIECSLNDWKSGPVVTQFRIVPARGVKVRQIANLANDLALAMKAPSIRIVAPVPGIGAVGIEVPNRKREVVALRDLIELPDFQNVRAVLPVALGKDLEGQPVVTDLARMPHLLIAGATGAGKSVCINTLITSLLYRHTPATLRMLMIDPKMVELNVYNTLPHLRRKVVTDNHDAATALKWAVGVMEERYKLLAENGARNLQDFNRKVADGAELKWPVDPFSAYERADHDGDQLPYYVIIIDELADLMMTVQGEVETPLAKLAQKARAIGIHLVLATQRPSVNVVTGLIKANFPSRIAFQVASQVDSRTIIDGVGAELLLGTGDMLFLPPGKPEPERLQGAYVSSEETERLVQWYEGRRAARVGVTAEPAAADDDPIDVARQREAMETGGEGEGGEAGERDKLFRDAAMIVIQHQQGSTSLLQRRLKVGYGRAARIIDQLHSAGVLGPPDGSKPRDVLVGFEELERICSPRA